MGKRILIIDDEYPTLAMFKLLLKALGWEVFTAGSGAQGMEIFRREKPPVVITDIKMAGMDGFGVLAAIREIEPDTSVIMITGHGDLDLEQKAKSMQAVAFLHKPVDRKALEDALEAAWASREQAPSPA